MAIERGTKPDALRSPLCLREQRAVAARGGKGRLIFLYSYLFVTVYRPLPASTFFQIGLFWLVLSLLFEFEFFHYAMHEPWEKLWADYNLFRGRLLIVVWLTTLFSPLICGKLAQG